MKKNLLLMLLLLPSILSYGQHKKKNEELPPPRVWIANIPSYNTTLKEIMANTKLITDSVGCRVSGFSISLEAPGHPFYGPLYSNTEDYTQVQKDVIKTWDYDSVTFYIEDIHLNCHEQDAVSNPVIYKFSH